MAGRYSDGVGSTMTTVPIYYHVAAASLCLGRLVTLFSSDKITEGLRRRIARNYILDYLLNCNLCLSVWAGIATTVMFVFFPWGNWPFALSWLYMVWLSMLHKRRENERERTGRMLKIIVKDGKATWENQLTAPEMEQSLVAMGFLTAVEQPKPTASLSA